MISGWQAGHHLASPHTKHIFEVSVAAFRWCGFRGFSGFRADKGSGFRVLEAFSVLGFTLGLLIAVMGFLGEGLGFEG